jgi:hypothetical protein
VIGLETIVTDYDNRTVVAPPSYERIDRFTHLLEAAQGVDQTKLPPSITNHIREYLTMMGITAPSHSDIKAALRRLALSHSRYETYYHCVPRLHYMITGTYPKQMSSEIMCRLHEMFKICQPSIDRHTPSDRKSAISYSFVINKLLQLCGAAEWTEHFPLLKGVEGRFKLEQVWKEVCAEMGWEYQSSF